MSAQQRALFTGFVLGSSDPVSVPDVRSDPRFTVFKGLRGTTRSAAGVRMETGAQIYGTITVGSTTNEDLPRLSRARRR